MGELYLVLHRVRGEPAFDVAVRACTRTNEPCQPNCGRWDSAAGSCKAREEWIIPTSGHRARPWWFIRLDELECVYEGGTFWAMQDALAKPMPPDHPDHYAVTRPEPVVRTAAVSATSLADLGLD